MYFTKSAFTTGLECISRLKYYNRPSTYKDESQNDPFLSALSGGGFQVGELAKFMFAQNPYLDDFHIKDETIEDQIAETERRLDNPGNMIFAEGAFTYNGCLVKPDIIKKESDVIHLFEVKSKGIYPDDRFLSKQGNIISDWKKQLYDVAFQKWVISNSLKESNYSIKSYLILLDKKGKATIDGLNQMFRLIWKEGNPAVVCDPGLSAADLGDIPLTVRCLDDPSHPSNIDGVDIIDLIFNTPVNTDSPYGEVKFDDYIEILKSIYSGKDKTFAYLGGTKCKECPYRTNELDNLKSGFDECWAHHTNYNNQQLHKESLTLELWAGKSGSKPVLDDLIKGGTFLLKDIDPDQIKPRKIKPPENGLSPFERRKLQIELANSKDRTFYFDADGFIYEMNSWTFPLHMIDFETSMPALPFHKGHTPFQGLAFQFSHHIIYEDGSIEHAGQYLNTESGINPNYVFAKALYDSLNDKPGTVFRYSHHENTYLRYIADQLARDPRELPERENIISFLDKLTEYKDPARGKVKVKGKRCMVDLLEIVLKYYYSKYAGGNNSLKYILPAIINDVPSLQEKYSSHIYGSDNEIKSLNFKSHRWIQPEFENDPYQTLGPVIDKSDLIEEHYFPDNLIHLKDGGAAMQAFEYLQYSEVPSVYRAALNKALLKYCELDTMAMVMLVEGMMLISK